MACVFFLPLLGCQIDPIPKNIEQLHRKASEAYLKLKPVVRKGDIIFRLGSTPIAGGILNFSTIIADMTESDFSHACFILDGDDILIADVTPYGIERRFFRDWHITGSHNIVVRRLRPEYRYLLPKVMSTLEKLIDDDILYNRAFTYRDDTFYCTQLVDYVFRVNGAPLADTIKIKDFPNYNWVYGMLCCIGGIDINIDGVIAGNEKIGLFSSPMLETVIDLRSKK